MAFKKCHALFDCVVMVKICTFNTINVLYTAQHLKEKSFMVFMVLHHIVNVS